LNLTTNRIKKLSETIEINKGRTIYSVLNRRNNEPAKQINKQKRTNEYRLLWFLSLL